MVAPAHDAALVDAWFRVGFGLQFAYAVRESEAVPPVDGLAGPSANRFGRVSPTTAAHVASEFDPSLLVLDGGATAVGIESAIVDCTRAHPVLLRPGVLTRLQIEQACGERLWLPEEMPDAAPRASGTLEQDR